MSFENIDYYFQHGSTFAANIFKANHVSIGPTNWSYCFYIIMIWLSILDYDN